MSRTITGAGAHTSVDADDAIPASKEGEPGFLTPAQLRAFAFADPEARRADLEVYSQAETDAAVAAVLDADPTLGGVSPSDDVAASQAAVKAYADNLLEANDAEQFKGGIDCSANPNYPAADAGHTYRVTVAGKIGGGSGPSVAVNDKLMCVADSTASGDHATVGASWIILQSKVDGIVIGPAGATDGDLAQFDGATGRLLKGGLSLDTDAEMASASLSRLAPQKVVKDYIDARRDPHIFDFITLAATRAAIRDFSISTSLSTAFQTACNAADDHGDTIRLPAGKFPLDASVSTSNVTLRGADLIDGSTKYGNGGTVLSITSTSNSPLKLTGSGFTLSGVNGDYPNQVDDAGADLIEYPPFLTNATTSTTVGAMRVENVNLYGAWQIAKFGGTETFNKAGLHEYKNVRGCALDTYFEYTHSPDMISFDDCKFGLNVPGDDMLHFSTGGAAGIVNIVSATRSGTTITIETATPHGLTMDSNPAVRGLNEAGYNVENIRLASVPDATHFTYETALTPTSPATGTGKVHNFKMRDKARDATWHKTWGNGDGDTLSSISNDGVLVSNGGFYGGGILYFVEGAGDDDRGGFLQVVSHNGGALDAWRQLLKVEPGGCVSTFRVSGVSGFQERVGDAYTRDWYIDIDSPAPGKDEFNADTPICSVSFTEFDYGFFRGGLCRTTGPNVKRVTIRGAAKTMLHNYAGGEQWAIEIDSPDTVYDIDMRFAGVSRASGGVRGVVDITANATNAIVRIWGVYKGWDHLIRNNSPSADVVFAGVGYDLQDEAIIGDYATNVRCSSGSIFDLHQRAFNPLRLQGVPNAVNGLDIGGGTAGYRPYLRSDGDDTNVGLDIITKGHDDFGSSIALTPGGFAGLAVRAVENAVNFFYVLPAVTGNAVFMGALGADADINMVVSAKGAGRIFFDSACLPLNNNTETLGASDQRWGDLYLGNGAVVDFNGDVTLTHSTDALTGAGGQLVWSLGLAAGTAPLRLINTTDSTFNAALILESDRATPTAGDWVSVTFRASDSAGAQTTFGRITGVATDVTAGSVDGRFDFAVALNGTMTTAFMIGSSFVAPAANDLLSLGTATLNFSDLFLSSGGVINFNNGDVTITHASNLLTFAGGDFRLATGAYLDFTDDQTTVGAAGGAAALPATPTGYIEVKVDGTARVIPYYAKA